MNQSWIPTENHLEERYGEANDYPEFAETIRSRHAQMDSPPRHVTIEKNNDNEN